MEPKKIEKGCEFAENCLQELKKVIHAPIEYTEIEEDGSRTVNYSDFGQKIFDILYDNYLNSTK